MTQGVYLRPKAWTNSGSFKKGQIAWNKGKKGLFKANANQLRGLALSNRLGHPTSEETKKKISKANKINTTKYWKTHNLSKKQKEALEIGWIFRKIHKYKPTKETIEKQRQSLKNKYVSGEITPWNKGILMPKMSGKNHPNWRGGQTSNRGNNGIISWRQIKVLVRCRDGFKCLTCNKEELTKVFEVHHKIPYRISKNNDWDNLETLCYSCHRKADWDYFKDNNIKR